MAENSDDKTMVLSDATMVGEGPEGAGSPAATAPSAKLVCIDSSQIEGKPTDFEIILSGTGEKGVGRDPACEVCIPSRNLSRKHARLFPGMGTWGVEDLRSTNGVFVNNTKVSTAWLRHGDEVRFGRIIFQYQLERPDVDGAPLPAAMAAGGGDDDDDEDSGKTIMFGGALAGQVMLEDTSDEDVAPPREEKEAYVAKGISAQIAHDKPATSGAGKKVLMVLLLLLVLGGIGAAGYLYYPEYQRGQEIEAAIAAGNASAASVVEESRTRTSAQIYSADYERELVRLSEAARKVEALLDRNRGHAELSALMAKLWFLQFEREFAGRIDRHDLAGARNLSDRLDARLNAIVAALPADSAAAGRDKVTAVVDLARFSRVLLEFRDFGNQFPEVSKNADKKPTEDQLERLQKLKDEFVHYRRSYNKELSVTYLVYRNLVNDVDNHDLSLLSGWREFLALQRDSQG